MELESILLPGASKLKDRLSLPARVAQKQKNK